MEVEKETLYQSYYQLKRDWRQSETMRKNIEQLIRPGESLSLEKEEGHFSWTQNSGSIQKQLVYGTYEEW